MDPLITLMSLDLFLATLEKAGKSSRKMFEKEPRIAEELVEKVNLRGSELLRIVGDFIDGNEAYRNRPGKPILRKENMLFHINKDVHEMLNYIAAADGELTPKELAFIRTIVGFRYGEAAIFESAENLEKKIWNEEDVTGSLVIRVLGWYDPDRAERYIALLKEIGEIMEESISPKTVPDPLYTLSIYWNEQYLAAQMEYLEILELENEMNLSEIEPEDIGNREE